MCIRACVHACILITYTGNESAAGYLSKTWLTRSPRRRHNSEYQTSTYGAFGRHWRYYFNVVAMEERLLRISVTWKL